MKNGKSSKEMAKKTLEDKGRRVKKDTRTTQTSKENRYTQILPKPSFLQAPIILRGENRREERRQCKVKWTEVENAKDR
jgi:hypothetical protein